MDQTICEFCDKWTAATQMQHQNRMRNMRNSPDVSPHPCPRCGGTFWASKPPPEEKEERAPWPYAIRLAVAVLVGFCVMTLTVLFARSEEAVPFPRRDGNCPSGYYQSGSYCAPANRDSRPAIPRERGGSCPSGWYSSGSGCVRANR